MATTLRQLEDQPAAWPDPPSGLSAAALALPSDALWHRIEAWTAHRWTPRTVRWTVEGDGPWSFPLAPVSGAAVEVWTVPDGWTARDVDAGPLGGFVLPNEATYRVTATVGLANPPPPAVLEAFRRFAEYLAEGEARAGASSYSYRLGDVEESWDRSPAWVARALQNSGAADLLRPYRRAP